MEMEMCVARPFKLCWNLSKSLWNKYPYLLVILSRGCDLPDKTAKINNPKSRISEKIQNEKDILSNFVMISRLS